MEFPRRVVVFLSTCQAFEYCLYTVSIVVRQLVAHLAPSLADRLRKWRQQHTGFQKDRKREREWGRGEGANTSVACLFKHVPVPWFLLHPLPAHPPSPFRPLRVERASTRAPLQLHCIIHTRDTEREKERERVTSNVHASRARFTLARFDSRPEEIRHALVSRSGESTTSGYDRLSRIFGAGSCWIYGLEIKEQFYIFYFKISLFIIIFLERHSRVEGMWTP